MTGYGDKAGNHISAKRTMRGELDMEAGGDRAGRGVEGSWRETEEDRQSSGGTRRAAAKRRGASRAGSTREAVMLGELAEGILGILLVE